MLHTITPTVDNTKVKACLYNMLFTNDLTCSAIIDAIYSVKKSPLYRQKTKQSINRLENLRKSYERYINERIKDNLDFYANANDVIQANVDKDIEILYYQFKSTLDKKDIPNSAILAKLEVAEAMIGLSISSWQKRINQLNPYFKKIDKRLSYLRLSGFKEEMSILFDTIKIDDYVNFNTPEAIMAMDIISKKLVNGNILAEAIEVESNIN